MNKFLLELDVGPRQVNTEAPGPPAPEKYLVKCLRELTSKVSLIHIQKKGGWGNKDFLIVPASVLERLELELTRKNNS